MFNVLNDSTKVEKTEPDVTAVELPKKRTLRSSTSLNNSSCIPTVSLNDPIAKKKAPKNKRKLNNTVAVDKENVNPRAPAKSKRIKSENIEPEPKIIEQDVTPNELVIDEQPMQTDPDAEELKIKEAEVIKFIFEIIHEKNLYYESQATTEESEAVEEKCVVPKVESVFIDKDISKEIVLSKNKNPCGVSLNMQCHEDDEWNKYSPLKDVEEDDVVFDPVIQEFVVTSHMTYKNKEKALRFGLTNIETDESKNSTLRELNLISAGLSKHTFENYELLTKQQLGAFKGDIISNYLSGFKAPLIDDDDLGLSVTRAAPIYVESVAPADKLEEQIPTFEEDDFLDASFMLQIEEESMTKKPLDESKIKKEKKIPVKKNKLGEVSPENEELQFAIEKCQQIFTKDELSNGIFPTKFNHNRSKVRVALNEEKINLLKIEIGAQFNYDAIKIEEVWAFLRTDLNRMLYTRHKRSQTHTQLLKVKLPIKAKKT